MLEKKCVIHTVWSYGLCISFSNLSDALLVYHTKFCDVVTTPPPLAFCQLIIRERTGGGWFWLRVTTTHHALNFSVHR